MSQVDTFLEILYEDDELLVLNKPAGLVCHPTKGDEYSSLIGRLRLHLGSGAKPHLVNRLDRETSGVTLVAKSTTVAGELGRLWERQGVAKEYLVIVHGHVQSDQGRVDAPIGKDVKSRVAIKDCVRADGAPAITEYLVIKRFTRPATVSGAPPERSRWFSLLRVLPKTGRKHQIRIHLAHLGHPIVGDKIYGADVDLYLALVEGRLTTEQRASLILPHQALHAASLQFVWRGRDWRFQAEPENWFCEFVA